jgi:Ubiquitin interaction motif
VQQFNAFNEMTEDEAIEYATMLSLQAEEERAWRLSLSPSPPGSDERAAEFMAEDLEGLRLDEEIDSSAYQSTSRHWYDVDGDFSYSSTDTARRWPGSDSSSRGSSYSKVQMTRGSPLFGSVSTGTPSPAAPDFEPDLWPPPGSLPSSAIEDGRQTGPSMSRHPTAHLTKGWSEVARSPPSAFSSVVAASPSPSPSLRAQTDQSRRVSDDDEDDEDLRFAIDLSLAEERSRLDGQNPRQVIT